MNPWRQDKFSNQVAWAESDRAITYLELCKDLDAKKEYPKALNILESTDPYQCMLAYLHAWETDTAVCILPSPWPEKWKASVQARLAKHFQSLPPSAYYFLPTSGTTQAPKLVVASRENWDSFFNSVRKLYHWSPGTRVALSFEPQFDPFVAMIFLTLSQGATLVPILEGGRFNIFEVIQSQKIEVWASVPSLVSLNWERRPSGTAPNLRLSIFTGEVLPGALLQSWQSYAPFSVVENLYGPVETTVWITRYQAGASSSLDVPIGRPLDGVITKIDEGELIVEGPQVTLGYLAEDGLHAFLGKYSTGDLVQESKGELYILGRKDSQVKLRGQRVELGLVESIFFAMTGKACVCGVDQKQNLYLVAAGEFDFQNVSRKIRSQLPASHCPRFYYWSKEWPTTSSGKVDRKTLFAKVEAGQLVALGRDAKSHADS